MCVCAIPPSLSRVGLLVLYLHFRVCRLISLNAKSFYDLSISYAMTLEECTPDPGACTASDYFSLDPNTGAAGLVCFSLWVLR